MQERSFLLSLLSSELELRSPALLFSSLSAVFGAETPELLLRTHQAQNLKIPKPKLNSTMVMPRKNTKDAMFTKRMLMGSAFREGQKELHCVFL